MNANASRIALRLNALALVSLAVFLASDRPVSAQVTTSGRVIPNLRILSNQSVNVTDEAALLQDNPRGRIIAGEDFPLVAPPPGGQQADVRLQAFLQLTFDRRPTTILSAWSELELQEDAAATAAAELEAQLEAQLAAQLAVELTGETTTAAAPVDAALAAELRDFQRNVTLGEWDKVGEFLASFQPASADSAYAHLLQSLAAGAPMSDQQRLQLSQNRQLREVIEKNVFSGKDIFGLASAAPGAWDKSRISSLAEVLGHALVDGLALDDFLESLRRATSDDDSAPGRIFTRRDAARLLTASGHMRSVEEFLPSVEEAEAANDVESLTLISQYCLGEYQREGSEPMLERAWMAIQAALAVPNVADDVRTEAIRQSVELAPKVQEEIGQVWLTESFTNNPERGMQILAVIGSSAASGLQRQARNPGYRQQSLELQKTAVEALLRAAPERAAEWANTLNILARVWLKEADYATRYTRSTSRSPVLQRDIYGNLFYADPTERLNQSNQAQPLGIDAIIKAGPNDTWREMLEDSLRPKLLTTIGMLHLRVNEDKEAFPYIERLAATHPEQATALATEFIRVWTRNHNPNQAAAYTDPYVYVYGFDVKAQSIPLTRAKQNRNLQELAEWIERIRGLELDEIDQDMLTTAFTTCHSTAEVYRLETINTVFGSIDSLKPETLASLAQRMRQNLAGIWRDPAVQQAASTNRKKQDLEAEIKDGYQTALDVVGQGIQSYPDDWKLRLAHASLVYDRNDYIHELAPSSENSVTREQAFDGFAAAAALYADDVLNIKKNEETTQIFEIWFYASLGSCDPNGITHEKIPAMSQIGVIRDAIMALPGESASRHMDAFANLVFTRMSALNPAVKSRYLDAAFQIVGDNERAHEARKVHEYYADLVQEIMLETVIDGGAEVGHDQPFGLFVNLRHTPEIERESGGFSKYLQNQNNVMYAYNYGRPLENYRDKFRDAAMVALNEHFDVLSVTFQAEDVTSRAQSNGWRMTPYAYILLKAKREEVDMLPSLRLDLDFLDTSGYVVLPIESSEMPIDCSSDGARPLQDLKVVQTLDERQAADGKLILEIKATAHGLVPELDDIVDLSFTGFDIGSVEDDGVSVTRFDPESTENLVQSERTWLVTMNAQTSGEAAPAEFTFAAALPSQEAEIAFQRYVDADLETVDGTISLEAQYGETSYAWVWLLVIGAGALGLVGFIAIRGMRRPKQQAAARFRVPEVISPFSVISLLRDIDQHNGLDDSSRQELRSHIAEIEQSYFDRQTSAGLDLGKLANQWVRKSARV